MGGELSENGDPMDEFSDESLEEPAEDETDDFAEQKFTISPAGRELFVGILAIEDWLDGAPGGPLSLIDDDESQAIVGAFIDGWRTGITHALAVRPLTLAELTRRIEDLDREELEAIVAAMRGAGLLLARPVEGPGASYAVTDWMREAAGPMIVAMRSEIRQSETLAEEEAEAEELDPEELEFEVDTAFEPHDVETAFVLALPLLELREDLSGTCRLVVELPESIEERAGVTIDVEGGRIASCSVDLEGEADAWAVGPVLLWMDALIDGDKGELDLGGKEPLAREVLTGLHRRLFPKKS